MQTNLRTVIAILRVMALVVMTAAVASLWQLMSWLPWQADCVLATASAVAFAYRFEREAE